MKNVQEIFEALARGKVLKYRYGWLVKLNDGKVVTSKDGGLSFSIKISPWHFDSPENWEIYEPPREKYYLWTLTNKDGFKWKTFEYLDNDGYETGGDNHFNWDDFKSKVRHDDEFVYKD